MRPPPHRDRVRLWPLGPGHGRRAPAPAPANGLYQEHTKAPPRAGDGTGHARGGRGIAPGGAGGETSAHGLPPRPGHSGYRHHTPSGVRRMPPPAPRGCGESPPREGGPRHTGTRTRTRPSALPRERKVPRPSLKRPANPRPGHIWKSPPAERERSAPHPGRAGKVPPAGPRSRVRQGRGGGTTPRGSCRRAPASPGRDGPGRHSPPWPRRWRTGRPGGSG